MSLQLGSIHSLPSADYHAAQAISHSKLEDFRARPALFCGLYIDETIVRDAETPAMRIGSAVHSAVLEPDTHHTRYAVAPEGIDRRTTAGKAEWAKFEALAEGKTVLKSEEGALVARIRNAVMRHKTAAQLLAVGNPEVSWRAGIPGLPWPCQCRTDWFNSLGCDLSSGRPYVVDVKTVESMDETEFRNFGKSFVSFGYHRQCGFYLPLLQECGVTWPDFFFIAVEKKEPFGVQVFRPTADAIQAGLNETQADLIALAKCFSTGIWPNLPEGVHDISLPAWYGK